MRRIVLPEILDSLPPDDALAVGSRRDLQLLNRRMHSADLIARELGCCFQQEPPARILEIGAGDGTLLFEVASRFASRWTNIHADLLDQQDLLTPELSRRFSALGWRTSAIRSDVFDWAAAPATANYDVILANLFLHHFNPAELSSLLSVIANRGRVFLALEPRRSKLFMVIARLLWLMGCNRVTRHDAQVSVRAGFSGSDLSDLWPSPHGWTLTEHRAGIFSHLFLAAKTL